MKHFSGLATEGMSTCIKSPLKQNSNHIVIHVETDGWRGNGNPEEVTKSITDIARSIKTS